MEPVKSWRKFNVVCENCGISSVKNNPSKTCGLKCREELKKKKREAKSSVAVCVGCGEMKLLTMKAAGNDVCSKRCLGIVFQRIRSPRDWDKWRMEFTNRPPLGAEIDCEFCGKKFTKKRYDARFCSAKCGDSWQVKFGAKGRNLRSKLDKKKQEKDAEIGNCSLCGVRHDEIIPENLLGKSKKNGNSKFHIDHVIPRSKGGTDSHENKRWLCWFCNLSRMDMDSDHDHAIASAGKAFWDAISRRADVKSCEE